MSNVKPIPEGYHTITPYLTVEGLPKLMDFLKNAFGAIETFKMEKPDGSGIWHAEMKIGDSMLMMGEANDQFKARPMNLCLYVEDVDKVYASAVKAGGKGLREPANQVYGDRSGGVEDPCGNQWWISTHVEDVSKEEMERRTRSAAG